MLKNRIAKLFRGSRTSSRSEGARRTCLKVESMESRIVLSSFPTGITPTFSDARALVGAPTPLAQDAATGHMTGKRQHEPLLGESPIAPENKLHGRRRYIFKRVAPTLDLGNLVSTPAKQMAPSQSAAVGMPVDLTGVILQWNIQGWGPVSVEPFYPRTGEPFQFESFFLTISSEDLSTGKFTGTLYGPSAFGIASEPSSGPVSVTGNISGRVNVSADGAWTYHISFSAVSGASVTFVGTVSVYSTMHALSDLNWITISGQFYYLYHSAQIEGDKIDPSAPVKLYSQQAEKNGITSDSPLFTGGLHLVRPRDDQLTTPVRPLAVKPLT
jgi:hypothetical protein